MRSSPFDCSATAAFEYQYLVSQRQARQIRDFVRTYLVEDEFSQGKEDLSYPVHSLYFDNDQLATYLAAVRCEETWFLLRVRYYDEAPGSPVFFEIKHHWGDRILKQRGAVRRDAAPLILSGYLPEPEHLLSGEPSQLIAVQKFYQLMQMLRASPKMHIAYEREAWVSREGNSVRVTLDKNVRGEARHEARFSTRMDHPVFPFREGSLDKTVLEIKFTNRFPDWLADLVRHFNLEASGAPKYCSSVALSGEEKVAQEPPVDTAVGNAVMRYF